MNVRGLYKLLEIYDLDQEVTVTLSQGSKVILLAEIIAIEPTLEADSGRNVADIQIAASFWDPGVKF